MLRGDELRAVYRDGVSAFLDDPHAPASDAMEAGLRAVAAEVARKTLEDAAFIVEEAMSNAVAETPEWWALHDIAKAIRAASISTDKAGASE